MSDRILPLIALLAFLSAPVVIGSAEEAKPVSEAKPAEETKTAEEGKTTEEPKAAVKEKKKPVECLASEEVIADLDARDQKLKELEAALREKEKQISAQEAALKQELARLEEKRAEIAGISGKRAAEREEQVNKLMETFEGMSPKAAAQVIGAVDEELAVLALGRLTSVKAGKILANLKPEKSSRLSEKMAFGNSFKRKEGPGGDSHERTPASAGE
jgi:flagellar motility protein MotE (MotC chaperone)